MFIEWKPINNGDVEIIIKELKNQYNELLQRHNKAALYMHNNEIPIETREQYIPAYKEITSKLNKILSSFDELGFKYTPEQVLEGFK